MMMVGKTSGQMLARGCRERDPRRHEDAAYVPFAAARQIENQSMQEVRDRINRVQRYFLPPSYVGLPVYLLFIENQVPLTGAVYAVYPMDNPFSEPHHPEHGSVLVAVGW